MIFKFFCSSIAFLLINAALGQNIKKEKMNQLHFMVGEWIGTSKLFENGEVNKQGAAFQKIRYDLDSTIIIIDLNTEMLQLHTIIHYDEKDQTDYYQPFSKNGARKLPAMYHNEQFIVNSNNTKRFIFGRTKDGGFREYGEELIDGKWVKYFEDTFRNSE